MILQKNAKGEYLYAIAFARYVGRAVAGGWLLAPVEYCHAVDVRDAVRIFRANHPRREGRVRVVAIAPAVGFHVTDNHGERLVA